MTNKMMHDYQRYAFSQPSKRSPGLSMEYIHSLGRPPGLSIEYIQGFTAAWETPGRELSIE